MARTHDRRAVWSWSLYDFANSAFTTLVVTFVYATYFTQGIAENEIEGTALWTRGITITAVAVALLSPFLGAMADRGVHRKRYLGIATVGCIGGTTLLRDLCFYFGQVSLQVQEVVARFQVGVAFGEGDDALHLRSDFLLGAEAIRIRNPAPAGAVSRLDESGQGLLLVGRKSLHRLDKIGNEIVSFSQIYIDAAEGSANEVPLRDETVVDQDQDKTDRHDDDDQKKKRRSHDTSNVAEKVSSPLLQICFENGATSAQESLESRRLASLLRRRAFKWIKPVAESWL